MVLSVAAALMLTFVSLKEAPQPQWQGFVKVRGLQVTLCASGCNHVRQPQEGTAVAGIRQVKGLLVSLFTSGCLFVHTSAFPCTRVESADLW
jgi:hypothetical protein